MASPVKEGLLLKRNTKSEIFGCKTDKQEDTLDNSVYNVHSVDHAYKLFTSEWKWFLEKLKLIQVGWDVERACS